MRAVTNTISNTKQKVNCLLGEDVNLQVNLGRNKIIQYRGKIENLYGSVFTVKSEENAVKTYSYSDVLTGNVKFV